MIRKQILSFAAIATLAAAGTTARADDITVAAEIDSAISSKTRAEVRAEVLKARADGVVFVSEVEVSPMMAAKQGSALSRDQVRSQVSPAARQAFLMWYPA